LSLVGSAESVIKPSTTGGTWEQEGLVGLISGHAGGRPRKLSEACLVPARKR